MSTLQIHCPGCGVRLDVPTNAGGRPARCPKCKTRFRVPDPHVMLDETVTCWLNLDHIHEQEDREEIEESLREMTAPPPKETDATEFEPKVSPNVNDNQTSGAAESQPDTAGSPVKQPADSQHGSGAAVFSEQIARTPRGSNHVRRIINHRAGKLTVSEPSPPTGKSEHEASSDAFPVERNGDRVKLYVLGVGAYGVRLGFPCRLLDIPAFRASMPMRGMMSGETDTSKLIARPLAWVDKATGHFTNPGELEARYELHVKMHQTPHEVVELMRPMDELPSPFNLPMPYYVSRADATHGSLHCETVATPRGIQCEVVIPAIRYALEWVGRVNGVCGPEYQQLETEALKYEAGSWRTIPQQVRHRLAVWFEFLGDEQFLAYLGDSDFAKSDLGLAGIIVTTQRLVWCKYHHHGAALLSDPGLLTATERGRFADLTYRGHDGTKRKMVRLRCEDVDALADLLSQQEMAMTMQIETASHEDEGVSGDSGVISVSGPDGKTQ